MLERLFFNRLLAQENYFRKRFERKVRLKHRDENIEKREISTVQILKITTVKETTVLIKSTRKIILTY